MDISGISDQIALLERLLFERRLSEARELIVRIRREAEGLGQLSEKYALVLRQRCEDFALGR